MALFGGGDQELRVTIRAKDEASKPIKDVQTSIGKLALGFASGAAVVGAFRAGFRLLSGTVTASIREFEEHNAAVAQMNAVLKSTQNAAGLTSTELLKMADALAKTSLYEDEAVIGAQNMLLTFTNITKGIFPETTKAVLDMSTALGQDLKSSAIQLGKALNNPIEGVASLQRVGVAFTNAQQEQIEVMVKSGHTLEAQTFILKEIQKEFGGSAESAYESASSMVKLEKNVRELQEGIGSGLTPALNNLFSAFQETTSGMGENVDIGLLVFKAFRNITEAAGALGNAVAQVGLGFAAAKTQAKTWLDNISFFTEKERADRKAANEEQMIGIGNLSNRSSEFLQTLVSKNEGVIASWGVMKTDLRTLGKVGPAAYQATAKEAAAATKKAQEFNDKLSDTRKSLESLQKALLGDDQAAARAFIDQEKKIAGLREDAVNETDPEKRALIMRQIEKEQAALNDAAPMFRGGDGKAAAIMNAERARAGLTDFGRELSDIRERKVERLTSELPQIVIQISGTIVGNDGINKLVQEIKKNLDRASTLGSVAGA